MKPNFQPIKPGQQVVYEIQVEGWIGERWMNWFQGHMLRFNENVTVFTIQVTDQAALRGIMNKIWDLNLTLVSAVQLERYEPQKRSQNV